MRDLDEDLTALFKSQKTFKTQNDLQKQLDDIEQPIVALHVLWQTVRDPQGNFVNGVYDQQTKDGMDPTIQAKWAAAFAAARTAARSSRTTRLMDALIAGGLATKP
jgi:hypothetical protein